VIFQRFRRLERHRLIAVLLEQPAHTFQHGRVVVDQEYGFAMRLGQGSLLSDPGN